MPRRILRSEGIRTTVGVAAFGQDPEAATEDRSRKSAISNKHVLEWVTAADRMRVKGVGWEYAQLLLAAGVKPTKELKFRNPQKLVDK